MRCFSFAVVAVIGFICLADPANGQPRRRGNPIDRIKAQDKNRDGKITKAEASGPLLQRFRQFDANGDGVIDEAELERLTARFRGGRQGGSGGVDEGKPAPDFHLKTVDGKSQVKLSSFAGEKPVALIFGSYT